MKNVTLLIVLLIISNYFIEVKAQTTEVDSLVSLLEKHNLKDTLRVNLLNKTADAFQNINPDRTLKYLTEASEIANILDYEKGKAEAFHQISIYYYTLSDLDRVLEYSEKSLAANKEIDNKKGMANNMSLIGKIYYFQGNVAKAMDFKKKALDINIALKDSVAICYSYAGLGTDYCDIGNYALALDYEKKALEIAYKINNEKTISFALNNLGVVYEVQGNYPKALEYYQKSFSIDESHKNYKDAAISASNIALILKLQGNYTDALAYCQKGLDYSEHIGFKIGLTYNYENMGLIFKAQGNYDKAWESHQKALILQEEIGNKKGVADGYKDLAELYSLQGKPTEAIAYYNKSLNISKAIKHKQIEMKCYVGLSVIYNKLKNYHKAEKYSKKAYTMANNSGNVDLIKQSVEVLAKSKEAQGQYKEAYRLYVIFKTMSDSLYNKENIKTIANLEYKYKYEKEKEVLKLEQQKKDKLQEAELKKQIILRNTLVGGFVLMILLVIVILRSFVQKRKANQQLQIKNKEIENQSEELKTSNESLVRLSQFKEDMTNMVIHDLKNPLSSILNIDVITDEVKRMEIVKQSGFTMMNLVQNILDVYKSKSIEMELLKEKITLLEIINKAIEEVEFLAKLKKLEFIVDMPYKIKVNADSKVLMRIFVNILSNAVKFSIFQNEISIRCTIFENNNLKVAIHNLGSHIPIEKQKHIFEKFGQVEKKTQGELYSTGLGLTYCKLAVDAHKGTIGVKSSENYGTTLWFTLPEAKAYGL